MSKYLILEHLNDILPPIKALLDSKVEKIADMGLSTNDFTTEEKEKLANLETGSPISLDRIDEICGAVIIAGEEAKL